MSKFIKHYGYFLTSGIFSVYISDRTIRHLFNFETNLKMKNTIHLMTKLSSANNRKLMEKEVNNYHWRDYFIGFSSPILLFITSGVFVQRTYSNSIFQNPSLTRYVAMKNILNVCHTFRSWTLPQLAFITVGISGFRMLFTIMEIDLDRKDKKNLLEYKAKDL
jgi:hypothetical protein